MWWRAIDSLFLDNCLAVAGSSNFAKDMPKENTTVFLTMKEETER